MTKESRWEPPAETDTEKLKHYMANYHSGPAGRPDGNGQNEGKIRCSHLLVKHRDSRRPSSWREAEITRSKEEAIEILRGHEERINAGEASLGDIAMSESDCSSARKRGDLYITQSTLWISCITGANHCLGAFLDGVKCRRSLRMRPLHCNLARSAASLRLPPVFILSNGMRPLTW